MHEDERSFDDWPEAVLLADPNGQIQHANRAAVALFGYSLDDFAQIAISDLVPSVPRERQSWLRALNLPSPRRAVDETGVEVTCLGKYGAAFRAFVTVEEASQFGKDWKWIQIDTDHFASPLADPLADPYVEKSAAMLRSGPVPAPRAHADAGYCTGTVKTLIQTVLRLESIVDEVAQDIYRKVSFDAFGMATVDTFSRRIRMAHRVVNPGSPTPYRLAGSVYSMTGTIIESAVVRDATTLVTAPNSNMIVVEFPGAAPKGGTTNFLSTAIAPIQIASGIAGAVIIRQPSTTPSQMAISES